MQPEDYGAWVDLYNWISEELQNVEYSSLCDGAQFTRYDIAHCHIKPRTLLLHCRPISLQASSIYAFSVNAWYDLTDGKLRVCEPFVVERRSAAELYVTL